MDDHSIHLLFSANRWEAAAQIRADIANGMTVIVDRYSYSGAVYSAAKDNPTLSLQWAWQPEIGLPKPDIWLFLNLSQTEAAKRGGFGVEIYENDEFQARVRQNFLKLIDLQPAEDVCVIDAGQSTERVTEDILNCVVKALDGFKLTRALRSFET